MRHIKGKDLNLLPVFAALWRQRNVTKAAQTLGMTQPALSRALSRLRSEFGDPLFVRSSKGVSPTARASEMASEIISMVDHLDHLYEPSGKFDPARLDRVFTIVTTDYFESAAAERLIPKILREAPHASLNFRTNVGGIPRESLEKGDVDLAILGVFERIPEGFYTQKILTDTYRSVVRSSHPAKRFTVEQFTQYPHILMTPKGDMHGIVDESLERLGKARHIAVGSSNFLSAGWAVANSDLILTAPGLVIDQMAERLSLREFQTPVETPQLEIFQIWHARTHNDPAQKWLRALIAGSF